MMSYEDLRKMTISLWTRTAHDNDAVFEHLFLIPGIKSKFYGGNDPVYTDKEGYEYLLKKTGTQIYSKLYRIFYL